MTINELQLRQTHQENALAAAELEQKQLSQKFEETLRLLKEARGQMNARESTHSEDMSRLQDILRSTQESAEGLVRTREQLRHRIVRLKLKLSGEDKLDMQSITRRLATENITLSKQYEAIERGTKNTSGNIEKLHVPLEKQRVLTLSLKRKLFDRTKVLKELTLTLENLLEKQVESKWAWQAFRLKKRLGGENAGDRKLDLTSHDVNRRVAYQVSSVE